MFSTAFRDEVLGTLRGVSMAGWTPYVGLLTNITSWRTPAATEATYTGYGVRPSATFGVQASTTPAGGRQVANNAQVTHPINTGSPQDLTGYGLYTAPTGGTLKMIGLLDADPPVLGVAHDYAVEGFVCPNHNLSVGQRVYALACPGAAFPLSGLSEGTAYFVIAANFSPDQFTLSLTAGGAALAISSVGAALFMPYTPVSILGGESPINAIGTLVVQL